MKRIISLAFLVILVSIASAFAADPFNVHEKGFGPNIQGLQLGEPMTLKTMIGGAGRLESKGIPATVFSVYMADSQEGVEFGDSPARLGKWILINFHNTNNKLSGIIMNGSSSILSIIPKKGSFDELLAFLKENGLNCAATKNITLCGERIIKYTVGRHKFNPNITTSGDFAQQLSKSYNLGAMEKKGEGYEVNNASEGWSVLVTNDGITVFPMPIPDSLNSN